MKRKLLLQQELELSGVVANCRMNRERELVGSNGYDCEIGFNPLDFLTARIQQKGRARWLDVGCGSGRALYIAADSMQAQYPDRCFITGIDLVNKFWRPNVPPGLKLRVSSFLDYQTDESFDLITCVHALHYIGDKLRAIQLAAALLEPDGRFVANLDPQNVLDEAGKTLWQPKQLFSSQQIKYERRSHRVSVAGYCKLSTAVSYLGGDDSVGPNYTGQPAVTSYYRRD